MTKEDKFESWAIVELFGHQRVAGLVTEQTIGGCSFIRVDVPAIGDILAMTKFYTQGAIYCMTPTTEELARSAAMAFMSKPIEAWDLPRRLEGADANEVPY